MEELNGDVSKYIDLLSKFATKYGPSVLSAVATLFIGLWVISRLGAALRKQLEKRNFDASMQSFALSILDISLKVVLVISVAGRVGLQTTSFVAVLGAAGLAVGLALQGSLSNFAGSVLLLIFKPIKVGDLVDVGGVLGTVQDIQVFSTILSTADGKTVFVPNAVLAGGTIVNLSRQSKKRINLTFGIGYGDDLLKAKTVLNKIIADDKRVLADPAPMVAVSELGDNSVNLVFRPWVKTEDYWAVYFDMVEKVKLTFDQEGISFPYPQQDVHLYKK